MNEIPIIITERVDDIPLLLEQMQRMGLPTLLDTHFPTHGNWTGLSLGWVSTIWLSSMLSRGDHRMVHVEPWVAKRLWTLGVTTGQAVKRVDFTDDRLEIVLRRLSEDTRWAAFESALNQYTVRVYDLSTARVHVDSTSASVYATVSEGGLFQFGHSKEYRPDLPQVKVMQAVLDPLGMPLATDVVSGERADDPLYMPCIARVQASVGRRGLQYSQSLSEKDRRRFAAVEAIKLGHGGIRSIANVLGCDPHTVKEGMRERKHLPADPTEHRVRKPGGGRKKTEEKHPDVIEQVQYAIKDRTAGDPMRQDVRWTDATPQEISDRLQAHAVCVGPRIVRRLLDRLGFA